MTFRAVPFEPWHVDHLGEPMEPGLGAHFSPSMLKYMRKEHTFTAFVGDKPVALAGTMVNWEGNYWFWGYLTKDCKPHMLSLIRCCRSIMAGIKGRLTMTTPAGFEEGARLAKLLGFEFEAVLKRWGPDGKDHLSFCRIQD